MKWFPHGMRTLVATGSLAAFLSGWILLGHAGKPVEPNSASAAVVPQIATLAPIASPRRSSGVQSLPSLRSNSAAPLPRLRTSGS